MKKIQITQELINKYLEEKQDHYSEIYLKKSQDILEAILKNIPKDHNLTPTLVSNALKQNFQSKERNKGKQLSRSSLKSYFARVNTFLNWLLGRRHPLILDFREHRRDINVHKKEVRQVYLSKNVEKMLRNVSLNYKFLIWLGCETSSRRQALIDLNLENLEFIELRNARNKFTPEYYQAFLERYSLETEITEITRYEKLHGIGARKEVSIILNPQKTIRLKEYLKAREDAEKRFKKEFVDTKGHYLFWNRKGERMKPSTVSSMFSQWKKEYGIDFTLHDTRRYLIQFLYFKGVREESIKKYSGHSKDSDTIKIYYDPTKQTATSEILEKTESE